MKQPYIVTYLFSLSTIYDWIMAKFIFEKKKG